MKVVVLGAGLVGGPMAVDLAKDSDIDVTVVDINASALTAVASRHPGITTCEGDLSDPQFVSKLVGDYDYAINAVPGFMGYNTLRSIIDGGCDVVDIAFFPESPEDLDELATKRGVTAIVDCGVAPGMSNILTGYADALLDETTRAITYVGGLPEVRQWPYEYKAVFSPVDVIEEYTRPARYVENGQLVTRPALSDPELLSFPNIGTLEAFNTDGLRSMAHTMKIPDIKEKTLRYPGHIDKMAVLRETGFFSQEKIEIGGVAISPLEFTSKLLFPKWKLEPGEVDITVMKVEVDGKKDGQMTRYSFDLYDRYDQPTDTHSMARVTGYTATSALRMLHAGLYKKPGITFPELLGAHQDCVEFLLARLEERGVVYDRRIETIG